MVQGIINSQISSYTVLTHRSAQFFRGSVMSTQKSTFTNISIFCGITSAVLTLIIIFVSGSPYDMLHKTDSSNAIPPIWVWGIASTIFSFLAGYATGILIGNMWCGKITGDNEISAYRGLIFFVALFFLSNAHYPLFFVAERFIISLIPAILSIVFAIACAAFWAKPSPLSCVLISVYSIWMIYVSFVNVCVLIKM